MMGVGQGAGRRHAAAGDGSLQAGPAGRRPSCPRRRAGAHREGCEGPRGPVAGVVQLDHAPLRPHRKHQALLVKGGGGQAGRLQQRLAAIHPQVPQPHLAGGRVWWWWGVCRWVGVRARPTGEGKTHQHTCSLTCPHTCSHTQNTCTCTHAAHTAANPPSCPAPPTGRRPIWATWTGW